MSWIVHEYLCPSRHRTSSMQRRSEVVDETECPVCGEPAQRTISAPRLNTIEWAAVPRQSGPPAERPPSVADTSRLADGESYNEWRESYAKEDRVADADLNRAARRVMDLSEDKVI